LNAYNIIMIEPRGSGGSGLTDFMRRHANQLTLPISDKLRIGTDTLSRDMESLRKYLNKNPIQGVQLKLDTINLFGYSYGAVVMSNYAHHYPNQVAALVLDSPDNPLRKRDDSKRVYQNQKDMVFDNSISQLVRCIDYGFTIDFAPNGRLFSKYVCDQIQNWFEPNYLSHLPNSATLKEQDIPTLIVSTTEDSTTPHRWATKLHNDFFVNSSIIRINNEDIHTVSFIDDKKTVDKCVENFLNDPSAEVQCQDL